MSESVPSGPRRARPVLGVLLAATGALLLWLTVAMVFGVFGPLAPQEDFGWFEYRPLDVAVVAEAGRGDGWVPLACALLGVLLMVAGVLQAVPWLPLPERFLGWPARLVGALLVVFGLAVWCEQLWPALTAPPGLQVLSQGRFVEAEVLHTWGQFFGLFVTVGAAAHLVVGATFMLRGGPGAGHHGEETESDGRRDREDGGHDA